MDKQTRARHRSPNENARGRDDGGGDTKNSD